MALPQPFLDHLREKGYHPRSDKHSNALSDALIADLVSACPAIGERAVRGELVYVRNFDLYHQQSDWNNDLVIGPPPLGSVKPLQDDEGSMRYAEPNIVQIAIEHKAVMTEHRKAVKNRRRDLSAYHEHVHRYSNDCIAAGTVVVNISESFQSPLRDDLTIHKNVTGLVQHCLNELRGVPVRQGTSSEGLDALCVLIVSMTNVDPNDTEWRTAAPAPSVGDPLHYDGLVQAVCSGYETRFC